MSSEPPVPAPPPGRRGRPGLIALILGIVAVLFALIPFLSYVAWLIGIAAIVVGIVALRRAAAGRGPAIGGLVLGIGAVLLSVVMSVVYTVVFFLAAAAQNLATPPPSGLRSVSAVPSASSAPAASDEAGPSAAGGRTVTYSAKGSGRASSITYLTVDSSGGGQDQAQNVKLPWSKKVAIKDPSLFSTTVFSLVVQGGAAGGTVTCAIRADGKVISKHSSTGAYAVATCSGSVR